MIIHNPILTGSFTVNGTDVSSITSSAASLTSLNAYTASQNNRNGTYATTGSNTFAGIQTVNSNLVVTGSITAQTLVVQTVTSSVVYSSGSNVFGNNIANTQTFTGSMSLTGSLTVVTTGTEFQVNANGVKFGNVIGDAHSITGSVSISGSTAFNGNVRINAATNGTNKLIFGIVGTDYYTLEYNDATGNINYQSKYSHIFSGGGAGTTTILTLANNGAATFASSVTANKFISNATDDGIGQYFWFTGNAAVSSNFSVYAYSNNVYINAYQTMVIRANQGTTGGSIQLSGGNVFINTASSLPGSGTIFHVYSNDACVAFANNNTGQQVLLLWNKATSGNNLFQEFGTETGINGRGSIDFNRAATLVRYNTTSDANLKNIIGYSDKQKSIDILNSTKIKEFSWKEDETNKVQIGVIAQELYETYKGAVSVGSDESLLGTEDYKSWKVDKTAFTFHLIAGWQKHEQIIQELQAQITELKNK
jgi:hypothetical protein